MALSAVAARKLALAEAAAAAAAIADAAGSAAKAKASVDKGKGRASAAEEAADSSSEDGNEVSENGIDLDELDTNAATVLSTDTPRLQHSSHASAAKIASGGSKPRYFQAAPDSDSDSEADSDAQEIALSTDLPAHGKSAARLAVDWTEKSAAEDTEAESVASASVRRRRDSARRDGSRAGRKRRRGNNGDDSGSVVHFRVSHEVRRLISKRVSCT